MPAMMVPSAAMRRLRREQISRTRNKAALAPVGGVAAKKPTSPAPRCSPAPTPLPAPRRADVDDAAGAGPERALAPPLPTPTTTSSRAHRGAAPLPEPAEAIKIGKGAQVRVRTRVGTVCTGQHLVLWLRAADEGGCIRVAYDYTNGKFPRVARVPRSHVRLHVLPAGASGPAASTGSSTATSDHSARPPSSSQKDKAAPRPTVAGKKLGKEMLMSSKAAIVGCL